MNKEVIDEKININNNYSSLIVIGTIVYSCIFYYCAYKRISVLLSFFIFMIFNIICCMYYSKKKYNISIKDLILAFFIVGIGSFIIQCLLNILFPFQYPENSANAFEGLHGLIILFAPFGVICLVPYLIYKILYAFQLNKIFNSLSIVVFLALTFFFAYCYIGTPLFTNSLTESNDFNLITIKYDFQNKVPIFGGDGEVVKYYKKPFGINSYDFYFVLNPGIYTIEANIDVNSLYLTYNDFCKRNKLTNVETCGYKIDSIKNDNKLYSYWTHYNQYHPGPNEVKKVITIQSRNNKNSTSIKKFYTDDVYIFIINSSYIMDGITIRKS